MTLGRDTVHNGYGRGLDVDVYFVESCHKKFPWVLTHSFFLTFTQSDFSRTPTPVSNLRKIGPD